MYSPGGAHARGSACGRSVQGFTKERMSDVLHMDADLVGPARFQPKLKERQLQRIFMTRYRSSIYKLTVYRL